LNSRATRSGRVQKVNEAVEPAEDRRVACTGLIEEPYIAFFPRI